MAITGRASILLVIVLLLFGHTCASSTDENLCCKVGHSAASQGHCQSVNISSALAKDALAEAQFGCELTAKMCCLKAQQERLCRRVTETMLELDPIDELLLSTVQQYGNQVKVLANTTRLSATLSEVYACDRKRSTDALCCLGCNLGMMWAVQRLGAWKDRTVSVDTLLEINPDKWCEPNEQLGLSRTVGESVGFGLCCRETIVAVRKNIHWCDLKPAPCSHKCHSSYSADNSAQPVQCSCYTGFRLAADNRTCVDIDECQELTHHCDRRHEQCRNTEGGFRCEERKGSAQADQVLPRGNCTEGYYFNSSEARCKDIDECERNLHHCDLRSQICRNLLGSFICLGVTSGGQCPTGYRQVNKPSPYGAPINCVDVDECAEKTFDCDKKREYCENFIGSYTCETKVKRIESSEAVSSTTTEKPPSTENPNDPKSCPKGYHFVRFTFQCEDINECRIGQHNCDLARQKCINFPGSYECVSASGKPNDPKEPARSASIKLLNEKCQEGYERNEELDLCEDIDECEQLVSVCPGTAHCQNTIGSFVCHCKTGYIKRDNTSTQCEDIDECKKGLHNCFGTLQCLNTVGSYECVSQHEALAQVAPAGTEVTSRQRCPSDQIFDLQLGRCVYFKGELREAEDRAHMGPNNSGGRRELNCKSGERIVNGECRRVECGSGFFFNATLERCQDENECLRYNPCRSSEKCTNTIGSYRCTGRCQQGYRNVGAGCEDIDECKLGVYRCPTSQVCKNLPGSYECECPSGYSGPNKNGLCEDIDECASGAVCPEEFQKCLNTPGSFKCECKPGYRLENGRCLDVDECEQRALHKCAHLCYNYAGSYKCACKSGYKLAADGFNCEDIDECDTWQAKTGNQSLEVDERGSQQDVCYFKCLNEEGSFRCVCPPGYESLSDGRICKDIDECESERGLCSGRNEYCLNVRGSYRCNVINCPEGYFLEVNSRKCMHHMDSVGGFIDLDKPLSYSYNYLSIVSNIRIPPRPGYLDILAMSGPIFSVTGIKFDLQLESAKVKRSGVKPAVREDFILRRPEYNRIIVALVRPLQGPQDVELVLTVSLFSEEAFGGSTKASISVVVSEYEF